MTTTILQAPACPAWCNQKGEHTEQERDSWWNHRALTLTTEHVQVEAQILQTFGETATEADAAIFIELNGDVDWLSPTEARQVSDALATAATMIEEATR